MIRTVPIFLAVEDELSAWVVRRIFSTRPIRYAIRAVYTKGGAGYLRTRAAAFNNAAKGCPFLLLTDLDQYACPPDLIADWLDRPRHDHFLLRVAVREVESWILGDLPGLLSFLALKKQVIILEPENLPDPKQELLALAMRCRNRRMREDLVWRDEKSGRLTQGSDYNGALAHFVSQRWNVALARKNCPSLDRLCGALQRLEADFNRR